MDFFHGPWTIWLKAKSKRKEIICSMAAFFIGTLFTWVPAIRMHFRDNPNFKINNLVFIMLALVQNEPSGTVGFMLESSFIFLIGCLCMGFFDYLVLPYFVDKSDLCLIYFIFLVFVFSLLKAKGSARRRRGMSILLSVLVFDLFSSVEEYYVESKQNLEKFRGQRTFARLVMNIIGGTISCLCAVFIFPRWAGDTVRLSIKNGLKDLGEALVLSMDLASLLSLQQHGDFEALAAIQNDLKIVRKKASDTLASLKKALEESKYEISYSYFDRTYYEDFCFAISRMLRNVTLLCDACERIGFDLKQSKCDKRLGLFMSQVSQQLNLLVACSVRELVQVYKLFQGTEKDKVDLLAHIDKLASVIPIKKSSQVYPEELIVEKSASLGKTLFGDFKHLCDFIDGNEGAKSSSEHVAFSEAKANFKDRTRYLICQLFDDRTVEETIESREGDPQLVSLMAVYNFTLAIESLTAEIGILSKKAQSIDKRKTLYIPLIWNMRRKKQQRNDDSIHLTEVATVEGQGSAASATTVTPFTDENEDQQCSGNNDFEKGNDAFRVNTDRSLYQKKQLVEPSKKSSIMQSVRGRVSLFLKLFLKKPAYRYALRNTIVGGLLGWICFYNMKTFEFFKGWRWRWAVATAVSITSPTLGAAIPNSIGVFVGTLIGCGYALFASEILNDFSYSWWAHYLLMFPFVFVCFYVRHCSKYGKIGSTMASAYSVVLFLAVLDYHSDSPKGTSVDNLALRRSAAMCSGVIAALIGNLLIFPTFARTRLRQKAASLCSDIATLYTKVMHAIIVVDRARFKTPKERQSFLSLEFDILNRLGDCQQALIQAKDEPMIRMTFPSGVYARFLGHARDTLNRLISIRIILMSPTKSSFTPAFRERVIVGTHAERKRLVSVMLQYLFILKGTLLSKSSLPPVLPDIMAALNSLNTAITNQNIDNSDLDGKESEEQPENELQTTMKPNQLLKGNRTASLSASNLFFHHNQHSPQLSSRRPASISSDGQKFSQLTSPLVSKEEKEKDEKEKDEKEKDEKEKDEKEKDEDEEKEFGVSGENERSVSPSTGTTKFMILKRHDSNTSSASITCSDCENEAQKDENEGQPENLHYLYISQAMDDICESILAMGQCVKELYGSQEALLWLFDAAAAAAENSDDLV